MGGDLIPPVDNVYTFDTSLHVAANNYLPPDSTRINQNAEHVAGGIHNDPLFGTAKATTFFQFKPFSFPFRFPGADSIRYFDSAVLILKYQGYYGDSTFPVQFNLYQLGERLYPDTAIKPTYTLSANPAIDRSKFWGTKTMQANRYKDTVVLKRGDTIVGRVSNQLRIPLDKNLASALFFGDSLTVFGSDSIFNRFLPGWALEAFGSPNALHYYNLVSGSEIRFYYQIKNKDKRDTTEAAFRMTASSGHAVRFERNRTGAEIEQYLAQNPDSGATQVYIDGTPGAMATVSIPGIKEMKNRLLHRVELRITEMVSNTTGPQSQLTVPRGLYLDVEIPNAPGTFRGMPFDLSPFRPYFCFPSDGIDFGYFGGFPQKRFIDGKLHYEYVFNITRHVQSVITRNEPAFLYRLSSPYNLYYADCINPTPAFPAQIFPFAVGTNYINRIGEGRVRLAGGNHPDVRVKMKVRVVYSRL